MVASRRDRATGPVDEALAALGLSRAIVAVVPSFRAALSIASASDLVALVTATFLDAVREDDQVRSFALPVSTSAILVSQTWHPRLDADPVHRWLRAVVFRACQERQPISR